jgi:hypothetical protein
MRLQAISVRWMIFAENTVARPCTTSRHIALLLSKNAASPHMFFAALPPSGMPVQAFRSEL